MNKHQQVVQAYGAHVTLTRQVHQEVHQLLIHFDTLYRLQEVLLLINAHFAFIEEFSRNGLE